MKACVFLFAFIQTISLSLFANQWSVSNHPSNPGQYVSITAALNDAQVLAGDTLLIHASGIIYPDVTLTKKITLIGSGFNVQNGGTIRTHLGHIFITSNVANGSGFYGLVIGAVDLTNNLGNIEDLHFENCHFTAQYGPNENGIRARGGTYPVNMIIKNCRFETSSYTAALKFDQGGNPTPSSVYVSNSWFSNGGGESSVADNRGLLIFQNCTFINTKPLLNVRFATFTNCIFDFGTITSECTDNIFINCIAKDFSLPPVGNTGANNISNTAVIFIPNTLQLDPSSPGYTGGNDGQQMGIYGGNSTYSSAGEPLITPITRHFNIKNTTIPQNGNLTIDLLVTKPLKTN